MVKLIALYKHPEDKEAFDRHYEEVHTPLAEKMPGLEKLEVTRIVGAPQGKSEYYLMAEMYFKDQDTLNNAMKSEEGMAAAKDLMGFAGKIVSMMIGEVK
ncbi:MAG: EthD family reductase [Bacillaceae bacterium]|nr:EthD family reductase [Bacillaceae bacterium]